MYVTKRPTTPFFAYLMFSIVCATARWQWRWTLWTGAACLAAFLGLRVYLGRELALDLNHFIILSVYLAVVAGLLGYLGVYEEQRQNEIFMLAAWPRSVQLEAHGLVREVLEHARDILHPQRVLMAWDESEEPCFHLALLSDSEFHWTRESLTRFQPVVAEPVAGDDFFCPDVRTPMPTVFRTSSASLQRWRGEPLHSDLRAQFGIKTVLSLKLRGETVQGRLFFLDKHNLTSDGLLLGQIVAREAVARLDLFYVIQQLKQMTAGESRFRIAHDLHDGLLQSLAVMSTKLEMVCHLLVEDPSKVRDRLLEIDRLLHDEQDGLRSFIREMKPAFGGVPVPGRRLA
jgi:signal transduction histidine kinase